MRFALYIVNAVAAGVLMSTFIPALKLPWPGGLALLAIDSALWIAFGRAAKPRSLTGGPRPRTGSGRRRRARRPPRRSPRT